MAPALLSAVAESRAALLEHLGSGAQAYGVNTGLGYLASRPVQGVDQAAFQRSILAGRASAVGRPLSEEVVRGAMLLRLTGFLSGYAGVSPELCSLLADRLNDGWFPVVPGGVSGAAGEIVPLAHLFLALVDEAAPPYSLGAKEGIALINGAPLAPALAAPLLERGRALLEHATLCAALAIAVTGASVRPYAHAHRRAQGRSGPARRSTPASGRCSIRARTASRTPARLPSRCAWFRRPMAPPWMCSMGWAASSTASCAR